MSSIDNEKLKAQKYTYDVIKDALQSTRWDFLCNSGKWDELFNHLRDHDKDAYILQIQSHYDKGLHDFIKQAFGYMFTEALEDVIVENMREMWGNEADEMNCPMLSFETEHGFINVVLLSPEVCAYTDYQTTYEVWDTCSYRHIVKQFIMIHTLKNAVNTMSGTKERPNNG